VPPLAIVWVVLIGSVLHAHDPITSTEQMDDGRFVPAPGFVDSHAVLCEEIALNGVYRERDGQLE
jgi:hypothetical protein